MSDPVDLAPLMDARELSAMAARWIETLPAITLSVSGQIDSGGYRLARELLLGAVVRGVLAGTRIQTNVRELRRVVMKARRLKRHRARLRRWYRGTRFGS